MSEHAPRRLARPVAWFAGRVTRRDGHSGALVPIGWACYNAAWLAVFAGMGGTARALLVYAGAIAITVLFAFGVTVSRWRNPLEPSPHPVSLRGDAGLCGALGVCFGGLAAIFGPWWAPLSLVMLVMGVWLAAKDVSARHRVRR